MIPAESGLVAPDEAWRVLRRRSRILYFWLLASLPGITLLSWLLDSAFGRSLPAYLVTLAFVAGIGVAGLRVARFACPRCGKPFFESWYFFQLLRTECAHCGLRRESGVPPGEARAPSRSAS